MGFPWMGKKGPNYTQWSLCCIVCLYVLAQPCYGQLYAFCGSEGSYKTCTTSPEKLTRNANYTISVEPQTATCGSLPSNKYFIKLGQTTAETCDATSHLPKYMVDLVHSGTWWQSATWPIPEYNRNQEYLINITLSFHKMYRLSQNISLTFKSGRPQRMILEKSADYGKTWTPLQYYSRSCSSSFPGIPMKYTREKPATVICTEEFSRDGAIPQPGRKVNFPGSYPRLSSATRKEYYTALDTSILRDLLCFSDLRIRLIYPNTDSKEKTAQNIFDFLHYYYAISDIDVTASCFCNQHGSTCIPNSNQDMECVCSHNTEGKDCERCKPLYNDAPWKAGSFVPFDQGTPNPCKKCECNDHAASCTYNATYGRGVCNNCQHNTSGNHCEKCQDGFFPNTTLPKNDTSVCLACNCEPHGVEDPKNMKCEQAGSVVRPIGGCFCKPLVTGRRCDICVNEYYGLLMNESPGTCKACQCNTFGTRGQSKVCAQSDGQCPCKMSTAGRKCDVCKAGYYQFPHQNPSLECKSCNCDPGGSKTAVCDTTYGVCTCREHISNAKCNVVDSKFFVPALDTYVMQPEKGDCKIHGDLWTGSNPFDGKVFAQCPPTTASYVEFQQSEGKVTQPSLSWAYHVGVRYTLNDPVQRSAARLEITVLGASGVSIKGVLDDQNKTVPTTCLTSPGQIANIPMTFTKGVGTVWLSDQSSTILDRRCRYNFKLRLEGEKNTTLPIRIDSVVLIPGLEQHVTKQSLRVLTEAANKGELKSRYLQCAKQLTSLISREAAMKNDPCRSLLWSVAAEIHNSAKPCECDQTGTLPGTSCNTHGGECRCKPGVSGRRCDSCRPGYYNMTGSGCERCPVLPCPVPPTTVGPKPTTVGPNPTTPRPKPTTVRSNVTTNVTMPPPLDTSTVGPNGTTGNKDQLGKEQNLTGLYIGLGLGVGLAFIVFILIFILCPKKRLRKFAFIRKLRHSVRRKNTLEAIEKKRSKALLSREQTLSKFGARNPKSPIYSKDIHEKHLNWISGEHLFVNGNAGGVEGETHEMPAFYFGDTDQPKSSPNTAATVHEQNAKNERKLAPGSKGNKLKVKDGSDKDKHSSPKWHQQRQPTFETFKSENPITVPAITIEKSPTPVKPKRKIKPASIPYRSDMPYVRRSKLSLDKIDRYNAYKDINLSNENLLNTPDDDVDYAGYESFDEVMGSLV